MADTVIKSVVDEYEFIAQRMKEIAAEREKASNQTIESEKTTPTQTNNTPEFYY